MIHENKVLAGDAPSVKFGLTTWPTGGCESGRGMPLHQQINGKLLLGNAHASFSKKVDLSVRRTGFLLV